MKKIFLAFTFLMGILGNIIAQDSSKLKISGSADIYYKYDFAQSKNFTPNSDILGTKQNSLDFGMLDLKLEKTAGKVYIYSDIAFGPRPDTKPVDPQNSFHIQNLYVTYKLNRRLSFSAGAMYKYQSFEKITPSDNFNYSMSKAWVQNFLSNPRAAGVRASYSFSDKVSVNAGFYNSVDPKAPADNVSASPLYGVGDFVAQLFVKPVKNLQLSAAYWVESQTDNGTHINFQAKYQLCKTMKFGLDYTKYNCKDQFVGVSSYESMVLYVQKSFCKVFTIGGRYEYMNKTEGPNSFSQYVPGYYNIFTLTLNEKFGAINFKQEYRFDQTNSSNFNTPYFDKDGNQTNRQAQIIFAAVYNF